MLSVGSARVERTSLRWHVWAAAVAVILVIVVPTRADPDLWGHIRLGLDWLQTHRIPSTDVYSFTHDQRYVGHEWLSEVVLAAAFSAGGAGGLVVAKSAIVLAALAPVLWRLRRATPVPAAVLIVLAAASTLPIIGTARPQVFSLLGLTAVLTVADSRAAYWRRVGVLAILFAVWANFHGGWITGLGALGAYVAVQWWTKRTTLSRAAGIVGIPFFATLLNPYGFGLWRFLATTVRGSRPDISEWAAIGLHEPPIMWFAVLFPVGLLIAASMRRNARPAPEIAASIVILIVAGLRVSRVAPLIGPAVAAALGPSLAGTFRNAPPRASSRAGAAVLMLPVLILWLAALPWITNALTCIRIHDAWAPDADAARYLEGATGRLWVAFDWGEYALWHFGPALRVSIDGRRETVYSDRVIQMHRQFDRGDESARAEFVRLSPEYVWLRRNQATEDWLTATGYRMLVRTATSFVAARNDVTARAPSAEEAGPACFP